MFYRFLIFYIQYIVRPFGASLYGLAPTDLTGTRTIIQLPQCQEISIENINITAPRASTEICFIKPKYKASKIALCAYLIWCTVFLPATIIYHYIMMLCKQCFTSTGSIILWFTDCIITNDKYGVVQTYAPTCKYRQFHASGKYIPIN